jgi:hypothetical protein
VAGEPVKPAAATTANVARIPLVKTAPGDADYAVVLKYGGELGALGSLDRVDFPLIRTLNIHVELSQVELHVPPTHRWFNFSGTMRLVQDEGDLAADWLAYNTKQIGLAIQSMKSGDEYSRARATSNLKSLQTESEQLKKTAQSYRGNAQLAEQIKGNSAIQLGLQPELQAEPGRPIEGIDNRLKLRGRFDEQRNGRASGVVNQAGENFVAQDEDEERSGPLQPPDSAGGGPQQGQAISGKWLAKNKLGKNMAQPSEMPRDRREGERSVEPNRPMSQAAKPQSFGKIQGTEGEGRKEDSKANAPAAKDREQRQLQRYTERLSQQVSQGPAPAAPPVTGVIAPPRRDESGRVDTHGGLPTAGVPLAVPIPAAVQEKPAALASLDVELHLRGVKYAFTTPRGDVEISARAVSRPLLGRAIRLALLALGVLLIVGVSRRANRFSATKGQAQRSSNA